MRCVVVHANAEAAGNPIKHHRANDRLPVPHEESTHGSEVECSQKSAQPPVDSLTFGLHHFTFLNVFQFNPPPSIQLPTRYPDSSGVVLTSTRHYLARRGRKERVPKFAALRPAKEAALLGLKAAECEPPNAGMTTRSIDWPVKRSMPRMESSSAGVTSVIARPGFPARPLRPMRCT